MKELVKKFIPTFVLDAYHKFWPFLGAVVYSFPSRKLVVVGVTGTNGKTTVVDWAARILEESGNKVASASSIRFKIGEKEWPNMLKMTMPGRMKLQKFLHDAVRAGCEYVVLEVTSEGIAQHRHSFIDFDVAVFTNLSPEHIERHGGFENYRKAKGVLFASLAKSKRHKANSKTVSIVNLDDENAEYFLQFPADEEIGFGVFKSWNLKFDWKLKIEDWRFVKAVNVQGGSSGVDFSVETTPFHFNILGGFNVYNALAAICVGLSQGVDLETCRRALEKVRGVPGRMEIVAREPFTVIVDYAHTPVALENVYKVFAEPKSDILINKQDPRHVERPKLICVLGAAGGGRDKWKRPELGRIAARYCDEIILTNEDPYDENPLQILSEIKSGISNFKFKISNVYEMPDREGAIRKALGFAGAGDTVVITGKGSEPWMCLANGKKVPWSDASIVREILEFDIY